MPVPLAIPLASALISGIGALNASAKRKAAEKDLEQKVNATQVNSSILDYFNKANNQYNPNAYQSAEYNQQMRNIGGITASQLNALQDRRSALAGISAIGQGAAQSSQRAAASAEQAQRANLGVLGQATNMKAGEENMIRKMKLDLAAQKAAAKAETQNALTQGAFNALGNAGTMAYSMGAEGNYGLGNLFKK